MSILLYGCTTWTLTKRLEKKLDDNNTRMLRAILNRSWQQHPTRRQLYRHLPPITKTIQARWTRHAGHCWRSRDEIVSDVLLWTPAYGQSKAGRPARTFIQQLCDDTGCNPEDLPEAMNGRETWRERVRDIRASRTSWWWWWFNIATTPRSGWKLFLEAHRKISFGYWVCVKYFGQAFWLLKFLAFAWVLGNQFSILIRCMFESAQHPVRLSRAQQTVKTEQKKRV